MKLVKSQRFQLLASFLLVILMAFSCERSEDDFSFVDDETGDRIEVDTDKLVIIESIPTSSVTVIEKGSSEDYFVSAKTPYGRVIKYTWYLDDVIVQSGSNQVYSITASDSNLGNHTLKVVVNDDVETETVTWSVKANGPPVLTNLNTGTPKVSVGSNINLAVSATDPNGDTLTYTWLLGGLPNANLVGSGDTAVLTGASSDVGSQTVIVQVSDGTATDQITFTAEVNYFPMACNILAQGEICTYAGNPNIGDGINPSSSVYDERIRPIAHCQDSAGNYYLADYGNHVMWFYNVSGSEIIRHGVTVPAGTMKVVAGSGEAVSGNDGLALTEGLYYPRGCAYHDSSGRLFISEYSGSRVKYVDTNGAIFGGMGYGSSTTPGDVAYNHDCDNPMGMQLYNDKLYVACYSDHMVREWDLNTDTATVVYGDGGGNIDGEGGDPTLAGGIQPFNVFVNADGIYVSHQNHHQIRFINKSGGPKTFWAGGTPVVVADNTVRRIIGTGSNGYQENNSPQLLNLGYLADIVVIGNEYYFAMRYNGRERLMMANDTGAGLVFDGKTVNNGQAANIIYTSGGYNGSNVTLSNARINDTYDLSIDVLDPTIINFSDYANLRLRKFDLGIEKIVDILGSGKARYGFYGDVAKPTLEHLFYYPGGLVFDDTSRNLYFTDRSNYRVRSVDAYGSIVTLIGRGNGDTTVEDDVPTNAYLRTQINSDRNMHNGIELMPDGSLVQLNSYGHNFRIWNGSGIFKSFFNVFIQPDRISTVAGDPLGSGDAAQANGPDGAALQANMAYPNSVTYYDDSGSDVIYIADSWNHCIRQLDSTGTMTAILGTCGTSGNSGPTNIDEASILFNRPHDVAIDSYGNLIIADTWNSKIRYWNRTASPVTVGIVTIDPGKVSTLVCNNGTTGSASEDVFSTSSRCYRPTSLDVSGSSLCYSNTWRHNVRCVDLTTGKVRTVAGQLEATPRAGSPIGFEQEGVAGTSSTLYYPGGLDFDASGDLFISDQYNHIIRKLKLSP